MTHLATLTLTLLFALAFPVVARAAEPVSAYPSKLVRLIVPYPAGGSSDIVARMMAIKLADRWKQSVIVENKVGASGIIATDFVANSPPDGYSILVGSNSATTIASHLSTKSSTFKGLSDLVSLTNVLSVPAVLVVNPRVPANTIAELIALLKQSPGKYNYGSSGAQSGYHLSMEQFQMMTGTKMVHVPYAGIAPAELALISGDVEVLLDSGLTSLQHIRSGRMRILGIASLETWPLAPEFPLMSATLPGFQSLSFIGLFAARDTPTELAAKITSEFRAILNESELHQKLINLGAIPSSIGMSSEDFKKFLEIDAKTWGDVIQASGGKKN